VHASEITTSADKMVRISRTIHSGLLWLPSVSAVLPTGQVTAKMGRGVDEAASVSAGVGSGVDGAVSATVGVGRGVDEAVSVATGVGGDLHDPRYWSLP
jgi:hypothetical protein